MSGEDLATIRSCVVGEDVTGPDGLRFMFTEDLPALVRATNAPDGFRWRWVLAGKVGVPTDGGRSIAFDGSMVIGASNTMIHALVTQNGGNQGGSYVAGPRGDVEVERVGSSGVFTKRPRSLVVDLPGGAMIGTLEVGELNELATRMQFKREGVFADEFG